MTNADRPAVRIAAGTTVVYLTPDGKHHADIVTSVDADRDFVEVRDLPGVLRLRDIVSVGVNGDEANYVLSEDGPGRGRFVETEAV